MLESLLNFEERALLLEPIALIGPGLGLAILGLFIWLGGFGFRKSLAAIVGGIGGMASGYFFTERNALIAILSGVTAAIIAAIFGSGLIKGSFGLRFITSVLCSALGAGFIFVGMTLLLIYKGAGPINYISCRVPLFSGIFIAMTIFGTIEHLVLCRRSKAKSGKKKEKDNSEDDSKEKPLSWRTS